MLYIDTERVTFYMVERRPGKIIELDNHLTVRLYVADLRDRTDVIVMTADGNAVEYGLLQIFDNEITFTDREDVEAIIRALAKGDVTKRNAIVYYGEYEDWLLYYFKTGRPDDESVFAASDDSVYALGNAENAVDAAAEVDEKLRELVASFVSQLPL